MFRRFCLPGLLDIMSRSGIGIPRLVCAGLLLFCPFCGSIFLCGTPAGKTFLSSANSARCFFFFLPLKFLPVHLLLSASLILSCDASNHLLSISAPTNRRFAFMHASPTGQLPINGSRHTSPSSVEHLTRCSIMGTGFSVGCRFSLPLGSLDSRTVEPVKRSFRYPPFRYMAINSARFG